MLIEIRFGEICLDTQKAFQPLLRCLFSSNKLKGYFAHPLKSFYKTKSV